MKHFTMLLLSVLMVAGLAFAGEEPDTRKAPAVLNPSVTYGTDAGWLQIPEITIASHQFVSVQYMDTVAWIAGFRTSAPADSGRLLLHQRRRVDKDQSARRKSWLV